jgi:hypothetical protein
MVGRGPFSHNIRSAACLKPSPAVPVDTLRSHSRPAQEVETRIAVNVLNRMLDLGRLESIRAA